MVHGRIIGTLLALFLASLLVTKSYATNATAAEYVPGEYLIKLKSDNVQMLSGLKTVFRAESIEPVSKSQGIYLVRKNNLERPEFAIAEMMSSPAVELVEPNYIYRIDRLPNDPLLHELWGLVNTGQKNGQAGLDINARQAWEIETGSKEIIVGVIDTGIDYRHQDIQANMWVNEEEFNGEPGVDDDGNGYIDDIYGVNFINDSGDPMDDHGHGTHVAGTIGATGNDGLGMVGVAWNVRLMGLKFLSSGGSGSLANAIKAIDYATEMGAHLTNNSWGGGGFSQLLYDSIERSQKAGQLFVAAAGNSSSNNDVRPGYPASYDIDNIVSVAAVDRNGGLARFSSYGATTVHVGAPGVDVFSATPNNRYATWSGTSMASPHVAGLAALLLSHDGDLSYLDVKERMVNTARPLASLNGKTISGGMIDAYLALINEEPPADPNDPANWDSYDVTISTPHPYPNNYQRTYMLSQEGASHIAVFFDRFETEDRYDTVRFEDGDGNHLGTWSGNHNGRYSPVAQGDTIVLHFSSDHTIQRYGFDISKVAYRLADASQLH